MNKMNKNDMLELADKLDHTNITLDEFDITVDLVCDMAYQLGYFFEAIEKIKEQADTWGKSAFVEYRGISEGYQKSFELLKAKLIYKEE